MVDDFVIFDNGLGDLNGAVDVIEFDSLAGPPNGFFTNSGFDAKGRVETSNVAGPCRVNFHGWQGYVDGVPIPNPTLPLPPLPNVTGLNTPYQTHGRATINPRSAGSCSRRSCAACSPLASGVDGIS